MKKGTKIYSILKNKCPHCHEGDFFEGSFFKAKPKETCDVCGTKLTKEPGFYQGSYYVVYALSVAVFVTVWCTISLFFKSVSFNGMIAAILISLLATSPINYPFSKIIWANFFFKYKGKESKS